MTSEPTNISFTAGEALLLVQLLNMFSDHYLSNNGCNDFNLKAAGLTDNQVEELLKLMDKTLPDEDGYKYEGTGSQQMDFCLVGHFQQKIMQAVGLTEKDLPRLP